MKTRLLLLSAAALISCTAPLSLHAQLINTIAGNGIGEGGDGRQVYFKYGGAMGSNPNGDIYVGDASQLFRIAPNGLVTVLAGKAANGATPFTGAATASKLDGIGQSCADLAGNIYVPDANNHRIRKISPDGIISTIAGVMGQSGFSGDGGPATSAKINNPQAVVVDSFGNLYISDMGNYRIRKIDAATGIISTYAGTGSSGFGGDGGPATSALFKMPYFMAIDRNRNLYISDALNYRIRKITAATGIITTVAGVGNASGTGDGTPAITANISTAGIAVDTFGNIFFADANSNRIRKITAATGIVNTIAGTGGISFPNGDGGPALNATMLNPSGLVLDAAGNVYFHDDAVSGVRKVNMSTGIITRIAGNATANANYFAGNDNYAAVSKMQPTGVAADRNGNIFVADGGTIRVRRIDATGNITTIAGNGESNFTGDGGPAVNATFGSVADIALDSAGNIFIADIVNKRIRRIAAGTGIISTYAGTGSAGFSGDGGPATSAMIGGNISIAADRTGNLYIADRDAQRIRKISTTGIITTVAGNGTGAYSGDGGPAASATVYNPLSIATDVAGNIYIADAGSSRIRRIDATTGIITTVAGNGTAYNTGDGGPATSAGMSTLRSVHADNAGNLYIGFYLTAVIRKVNAATGIIETIAGTTGGFGFNGDGHPAISAKIGYAWGFTSDSSRNLFFADNTYYLVRAVCNSNRLAGNGARLRWPVADTLNTVQVLMDRCDAVMGIKISGGYPISTVTDFRVTIDPTVQTFGGAPYVQRHYDIEPLVFPSLYTDAFTFYYTQAEFDAYNIAAGTTYNHLPTGPSDAVGITAVRLTQYKGRGTAPGAYTGWTGSSSATQTFTPLQTIWNGADNRWEITVVGNAFGGFYLGTEAAPVPPQGVTNLELDGIRVYPNPVTNAFTIQATDAVKLQQTTATISDMQGRTLKTFTVVNRQPVAVNELASGMYLLQLSSGQVFKLVKQ